MRKSKKKVQKQVYSHVEDIAQKAALEYFGTEVLSWLNIHEKVQAVAPTEHVRLEMRHTYEDFCFVMENGEWYHFEFESGRVERKDLKRFREYEATTSRVHDVDVITFVVCSHGQQKLVEELKTGINNYKIRMILLKDILWDQIIDTVSSKEEGTVNSSDLIPVALSPLIGGSLSVKERIRKGFEVLSKAYPAIGLTKMKNLQAILYILSTKFLKNEDLKEIKEVFKMNYLGRLVYDEGYVAGEQNGEVKGKEQGIMAMILDNLEFGITRERILMKLQKHFQLQEDKAEEYYEKYAVQ